MEHKQQRDDLTGRHAARVAPARRGPTALHPIAAQTPCKNHRPRKKPRRSDPTSSPPSLSDGRLPQKAFQAQSLSRTKTPYPGYYKAKYYRLKARQDAKRALMAISHKILVAVFQMLSRNEGFRDLGEAYLDRLAEKRVTLRLVERLNALGYQVELKPKAAT